MLFPMRRDLLVQEHCDNPWEHMVCVILLNKTSHVQVRRVLPKLMNKYPTPEKMARAGLHALERLLAPCGMYASRAKYLKRMSAEYGAWDGNRAEDLTGIGKYGSDSYRIFWKGEKAIPVQDKTLRRVVAPYRRLRLIRMAASRARSLLKQTHRAEHL